MYFYIVQIYSHSNDSIIRVSVLSVANRSVFVTVKRTYSNRAKYQSQLYRTYKYMNICTYVHVYVYVFCTYVHVYVCVRNGSLSVYTLITYLEVCFVYIDCCVVFDLAVVIARTIIISSTN